MFGCRMYFFKTLCKYSKSVCNPQSEHDTNADAFIDRVCTKFSSRYDGQKIKLDMCSIFLKIALTVSVCVKHYVWL